MFSCTWQKGALRSAPGLWPQALESIAVDCLVHGLMFSKAYLDHSITSCRSRKTSEAQDLPNHADEFVARAEGLQDRCKYLNECRLAPRLCVCAVQFRKSEDMCWGWSNRVGCTLPQCVTNPRPQPLSEEASKWTEACSDSFVCRSESKEACLKNSSDSVGLVPLGMWSTASPGHRKSQPSQQLEGRASVYELI